MARRDVTAWAGLRAEPEAGRLPGNGCLATAAAAATGAWPGPRPGLGMAAVPVGTFPGFMTEGTLLYRRGEYGKALACFDNVREPGRPGGESPEGTGGRRGHLRGRLRGSPGRLSLIHI